MRMATINNKYVTILWMCNIYVSGVKYNYLPNVIPNSCVIHRRGELRCSAQI